MGITSIWILGLQDRLQDSTYVGPQALCPDLCIWLNIWGQWQLGCLPVALHAFYLPAGLLCSGQAQALGRRGPRFQRPHSAALREGRGGVEGLRFLPPSELVHTVKHRGPAVTADHIQSNGSF